MSKPNPNDLLHVATQAARLGGAHTLKYFNRSVAVEMKSDQTPVTQADREAESLIRDFILQHFPNHSILGEEHGTIQGDPDYQWVIDPIDGTKSFIHGVPLYTTLVGLQVKQQPVVGVIYAPVVNEMVSAATGLGCRFNDRPCRVSEVKDLSNALICVSDALMAMDRSDAFETLARRCKYSRTWGDAYGYLLVATGRCEIMLDPKMNPWDVCALIPVIEEAGGVCTSWAGERTIEGGDLFACNKHLAPFVSSVLKKG
ncbi:MAG: histidinol phosphate phosphatase [Phycisphaerae bacterium]|jgi:histidinol phosphatase-like enzyme (inositol monophosphatase family)|nr:MAG: histidinol phosphate phosphatase [Phycisphaerae bacterium]